MKISIITSPFGCIPPHAIGAVEKLWYNVSKVFVENNNQVCFLSKKPNELNVSNNIFSDGVNIKYIAGYEWQKSQKVNIILDLIYSIKALVILEKTDILILNTFWTPLLAIFFKWKYKKVVYNVARFPKGQFKFYKYIDRLSCVSTAVYNALISQTPERENQSKTIPNPVDLTYFYPQEKIYSKTFTILYSGRIHPEKGLTILAEAFDKLCEKYSNVSFELKLVGATSISNGGGGKIYINEINSKTTRAISYIPPIYDPKELATVMNQADIYCYPSLAEKGETFGVAPLEAMALGKATIVSNLDCFKDFAIHNQNAYIFNHRESPIDNLFSALEKFYLDENLRNRIAIQASKDALQFSNKNIADLYLKDFESLLSH
jgi:glycosyltransferase involved in cell wall biosynthesis